MTKYILSVSWTPKLQKSNDPFVASPADPMKTVAFEGPTLKSVLQKAAESVPAGLEIANGYVMLSIFENCE